MRYLAGVGGYIEGEDYQELYQGDDASPIKVIANDGYVFLEWSDGSTSAERHDLAIETSVQYTAEFRKISDSDVRINLDYRGVDKGSLPENLYFNTYDTEAPTFPVPTREHYTFDGWYMKKVDKRVIHTDKKIADADGKLTEDIGIFKSGPFINSYLIDNHGIDDHFWVYAKWTANETFDYKVLLVYFEDVTVEFTSKDTGEKCEKRYIMSEEKRQECRQLTLDIKKAMDEALEGLVDFQVDEYYVTSPKKTTETTDAVAGALFPESVEEISDIADDYKAVFSLTDCPEHDLEDKTPHKVEGSVFLSSMGGYTTGGKYAEVYIDQFYNKRNDFLNAVLHEFSHIIEFEISLPNFHESAYWEPELYLSHRASLNGEQVGVPYEYWKDNIFRVVVAFYRGGGVNYIRNKDGKCGTLSYKTYGSVIEFEAFPEEGYRFASWSDGVTTPYRKITVTEDILLFASFAKIEDATE